MSAVTSFKLLDGTSIPWLGWGNGTGEANVHPVKYGALALDSGVLHIDTAQNYHTEKETGEAIRASSVSREDIYVTSKLSGRPRRQPIPYDEVVPLIEASVAKLGFIPDLFLIHSPWVAEEGKLKELWQQLESLKDQGKLRSIGVSNFRPQDLEAILDGSKYKPVINQIEYHPYVLAHLQPVLALHAKYGIVTQSFGTLTPTLRHPTGGPLKPVLERISQRISSATGREFDVNAVLMLWARQQGVVVVTASGNPERIKRLGELASTPDLLTEAEIEEISRVGMTIHYRSYDGMMETGFPIPDLPRQ